MQGDIYQLEDVLDRQHMESSIKARKTTRTSTPTKSSKLRPQVSVKVKELPALSVYDEDSPTHHYRFQGTKAFDDAELGHAYEQAHYLNVIATAFDDYCTDSPLRYFSDESAISDEDEEDEDDHLHEHASQSSSPSAKSSPVPITLTRKRGSDTTTHARRLAMSESPRQGEARKAADAVQQAAVEHVSRISGPLMSWWPLPLELQEHEWTERFYE